MASTVTDGLALCGVPNRNVLFQGRNAATRIASDDFGDDFVTCMDITFEDLDNDWKTYSSLTVAQGQIRLQPNVKKNICAFVQWCRDRIRTGNDPADDPFPVNEATQLIQRHSTHKLWTSKSSDKAKTCKPKQFTDKVKWLDWKDSFVNFLRTQPGRNGVPLSYVVRNNETAIIRVNPQFLDDYVDQAPLHGPAFAADVEEVHSYIIGFITENPAAENKILPFATRSDGRVDFIALKEHYEGVGANAKAIVKAEDDITNMFYSGEKKPHMWWEEFETRLSLAFATLDKEAGRIVHSDVSKLRLLNRKVKADFLEPVRTSIELELARVPMTMTYNTALATYRNAVNRKFPDDDSAPKRTRRINETSRGRGGDGRGGRGRGGRGGRGRGRGRGRGDNKRNSRLDAWFIQCTDGCRLEVHPAYSFSDDQWSKIPQDVRDRLLNMRQDYKRRRQASQASIYGPSAGSNYAPRYMQQASHGMPPPPPAQHVPPPPPLPNDDNRSQVSEITQSSSIMGGRNEQANLRSRNQRNISNIRSQRKIGSSSISNIEPRPHTSASNEADTNADTCCAGTNFIPIQATNRTADVYPYDSAYSPAHNVPIVTAATAYDSPDGVTYILVFHECLYYGTKLDHSLINPNQLRHYGVHFWDNPYDHSHELCIDHPDGIKVPLQYLGTKLAFTTRVPTNEELATCSHVEMTSDIPWEPSTVQLGEVTASHQTISQIYRYTTPLASTPYCHSEVDEWAYSDPTSDSAILHSIDPSVANVSSCLIRTIAETHNEQDSQPENVPARRTFVDTSRHLKATAESLAELWHIGLTKAKKTMNATPQRGIRSAILPLSRRYRSDRMYNVK